MGNTLIPDRVDADTITDDWYNLINAALELDIYPRDSSGAPTDLVASLGTTAFNWKLLFAEADMKVGDIKMHHSYNGAVLPGDGWMLCDGRQVSQTNYDTEHGAGAWAQYIVASPLDNKYLPDLVNRYAFNPSGSTTQDGTLPLTAVGNANHTALWGHNHIWYHVVNNTNASDQDGAANNITSATKLSSVPHVSARPTFGVASDLYTSNVADIPNVRPESIEVQFYMRII